MRLPLSAALLIRAASADGFLLSERCGEYAGLPLLEALDDLLGRLQAAAIFVMLDMHTLDYPAGNNGLWCNGESVVASGCSRENERPIHKAWRILATRYCSAPNVIPPTSPTSNQPPSTSPSIA